MKANDILDHEFARGRVREGLVDGRGEFVAYSIGQLLANGPESDGTAGRQLAPDRGLYGLEHVRTSPG